MELPKIIEMMASPEKLQDPNEIVLVNQYVSGFMDHFKQEIYEQNIRVSEEWQVIRKEYDCTSDKMANQRQLGKPEHRKLNELERLVDRLQQYRSDNNKKYELITKSRFLKSNYR